MVLYIIIIIIHIKNYNDLHSYKIRKLTRHVLLLFITNINRISKYLINILHLTPFKIIFEYSPT